jgi:hypothetical protein
MTFANKCVAVFGATGHTGQFVVQELLGRGLSVVAVGRDQARLDASLPHVAVRRTAAIDDPNSLEQAFAGCEVVINCAGPFLDTAAAVARAALNAKCHYIDVTAEQPSVQSTFADLDEPARQAGRVVVPAAAFYGGLADLLASALGTEGSIDEITIAIALDRWWPTEGTRKTGERNKAPRLVVKDGRLAPFQPSNEAQNWTFSPPLGRQAMVEMPFSEIITLAHHLQVREVRSLLNSSALADIRDASTPTPVATDELGRSAQRFELVVRLSQGGLIKTAGVRGQDIYAVTAPIVTEVALRLMHPSYQRNGALAVAEAVDPRELLGALNGPALQLFGDAFSG